MATLVDAPLRVPYRYGLLSAAEVVEHAGAFRLSTPYTFDSVSCNEGFIWEPECAPVFTVTFTKSAVADTYNVTVSPGVLADYEVNVNNAGFVPLTATVVSTDAAPTPVVVREVGGLSRSVTNANVNFDATTGTVVPFVSGQTDNVPKPVTEGIGNAMGSPFVVGARVNCTLMGGHDFSALALEAINSVENRLVEERFWSVQLAASSPATPAGAAAVSLVEGVAVLEQYLRDTSGYVGTIHSSSYVGAYASSADLVHEYSSEPLMKHTALGTKWAFGGGYPVTGATGSAAPTAGQAWIFGTGAVQMHRGDVFIPGSRGENFSTATNQEIVMAERPYAVLSDCPTAAVLVDTSV